VPQPTCAAFGGGDLSTLFVTTARQGLPDDAMDGAPRSGMTLSIPVSARGQAEHRVIL
jgi:sugar lactone lactonase YvrE